jgi:phage terminase large subunit
VLTGLDFGYKAPSAMVRVGIKDEDLYIFEEYYKPLLINSQLISELKKVLPDRAHIIADCAEPDRIAEFNLAGFIVDGVKNKSRQASIDFLKSKKIHIDDRCVNTIREFQTCEWKKTRSGRYLEGEFADGCEDHAIDAIRYAVEPIRWAAGRLSEITERDIVRGKRKSGELY